MLGPSQKGARILKAAGLKLEEEFVGSLLPRICAYPPGPPHLPSLVPGAACLSGALTTKAEALSYLSWREETKANKSLTAATVFW